MENELRCCFWIPALALHRKAWPLGQANNLNNNLRDDRRPQTSQIDWGRNEE